MLGPERVTGRRVMGQRPGAEARGARGRNADTLKRLQAAEKQLREQQQAAYVDLAKSEEERKLGNEARPCARVG